MTPDKPARTHLPWVLVLLLGLVALAGISALRDATTSLAALSQASGQIAEVSVLRRSGNSSGYTLLLVLRGQPGLFGVYLGDAASTARALQQRLPVGSPATVYYQKPVLFSTRTVSAVWQLESQGTVLYALSETHQRAWKKLTVALIVLGIGGALWWGLRVALRRAA